MNAIDELKVYWTKTSNRIVMGGRLEDSDLYSLGDLITISRFKPEFLPSEFLVSGQPFERKETTFSMAKNLWGVHPETWLSLERKWLAQARKVSGSQETGGKDKFSDVVSPEILLQILAAIKLVHDDKRDKVVTREVVLALNTYLQSVIGKGRSRMEMVGGLPVYSMLKNGGLSYGYAGGKYLPNPKVALPELLAFFYMNSFRNEVYQK
jgi:hypothetical protein